MNLPLNFLLDSGTGMVSLFYFMSAMISATTPRIPFRALSGEDASQLKLGNSAQSPTYSPSSSDQVTRYV